VDKPPHVALSLMPDDDFRDAALPLFESGAVDALEWSVDATIPEACAVWTDALLDAYSSAGRLYGHGVHLSPFSARSSAVADRWLDAASARLSKYPCRLVSEHVGTSRAASLLRGAPLPTPACAATITTATANLRRLASAAGPHVPIGLENLALAFSRDDALAQGALVDAILEPFGDQSFVTLDLHNAFCQMYNFAIDAEEWLASWPLDRVRVLHLSGGSWATHHGKRLRRDTHDASVPDEVIRLLTAVLDRVPSLELVVLEWLGGTIEDRHAFARDFRRIHDAVSERRVQKSTLPRAPFQRDRYLALPTRPSATPLDLAAYQDALVDALSTATDGTRAKRSLAADPRTAPFRTDVDAFDPAQLDIARSLVETWSQRA
jgi:hypothetical protein